MRLRLLQSQGVPKGKKEHTLGFQEPLKVVIVEYPSVVRREAFLYRFTAIRIVILKFWPWDALYCGGISSREQQEMLPR